MTFKNTNTIDEGWSEEAILRLQDVCIFKLIKNKFCIRVNKRLTFGFWAIPGSQEIFGNLIILYCRSNI